MKRALDGFVLINKTVGETSRKTVDRTQYLFAVKKAGHTGTLDPMASGLLPICFGEATKFSQFLLDSQKAYRATIAFGVATDTGDAEGQVIAKQAVPSISKESLETCLQTFVGQSFQTPPMFSALKKDGQPLYKLARKGIEVPRPQRLIIIDRIARLSHGDDFVEIEVSCSKGTYIRSLAEDVGKALGCPAHLSTLHRIAVGGFQESQMTLLEDLESIRANQDLEALSAYIYPTEKMVSAYPSIMLKDTQFRGLIQGRQLNFTDFRVTGLHVLMLENRFVGMGIVYANNILKPVRLISA